VRFGLLDLFTLAGSGRLAGLGILGCLLVSLVLALWWRDRYALLLAAGVLGPWLALLVVRPHGDAYAYGRYLIPSLTFVCLWVARTGDAVARIAAPRRFAPAVALVLPIALVGAAAAGDGWPIRSGPHGNTYLNLMALPAFDAPWPERSRFYETLDAAGPVTLIEAPALVTRARHLHRNAYLQHRRPTLLGLLPEEEAATPLPAGPYVSLTEDDLRGCGADYLLLHLDAASEVARYWEFVYGLGAARAEPWQAFMARHRDYFPYTIPQPSSELVAALQARLGRPHYRDHDLLVWRLRPS
jgi:hypothetical protein